MRTRSKFPGAARFIAAPRHIFRLFVVAGLTTLGGPADGAELPLVAVSLPPLQALAAAVMDGAGSPHLLIPAGASPHAYALKPSAARRLAAADIVFRVGPHMETVLVRPLQALAGQARIVDLIAAPGLTRRAFSGTGKAAHDHAAHKGYPNTDPHIWLDPANARAIARTMAAALAAADPERAALYRKNAADLARRLGELDRHLAAQLATLAGRPYVVFHDAYQYLEARYGLTHAAVVAADPHRQPGAQHVSEIRRIIATTQARCLFTEPQFPPRLAATISAGLSIRTTPLDPLGVGLTPGPDAYFQMMRGLGNALAGCLSDAN